MQASIRCIGVVACGDCLSLDTLASRRNMFAASVSFQPLPPPLSEPQPAHVAHAIKALQQQQPVER